MAAVNPRKRPRKLKSPKKNPELDFRPYLSSLSRFNDVPPNLSEWIFEAVKITRESPAYFAATLPYFVRNEICSMIGASKHAHSLDTDSLLFYIREFVEHSEEYSSLNLETLDTAIVKAISPLGRSWYQVFLAFCSYPLNKPSNIRALGRLLVRPRFINEEAVKTIELISRIRELYESEDVRKNDEHHDAGSFWESDSRMTPDIEEDTSSKKSGKEQLARKGITNELFTSVDYDWAVGKIGYFFLQESRDSQQTFGEFFSFIHEMSERLHHEDLYSPGVHRQILDLAKAGEDFKARDKLEHLGLRHRDFLFSVIELVEMIDREQIDDIEEDINPDDSLDKDKIIKFMLIAEKLVEILDRGTEDVATTVSAWNTFKTVLTKILTSSQLSKKKLYKWFRENFDIHRINAWNRVHFGRKFGLFHQHSNEEIRQNAIHCFDNIWLILFGPKHEMIPMVSEMHQKYLKATTKVVAKISKNRCKFEEEKNSGKRAREDNKITIEEVVKYQKFRLPAVSSIIYSNLLLWRDVGLLLEMPKWISFHVVLKVIAADRKAKFRHQQWLFRESAKGPPFIKNLMIGQVFLAEEVNEMFHLRGEKFTQKYEDQSIEKVTRFNNRIYESFNQSVASVFYRTDEEQIMNALREFYVQGLGVRRKTLDPSLRVVVKRILGQTDMAGWGKKRRPDDDPEIAREWVRNQPKRLRRLWNFKPLDRKLENMRFHAKEISVRYKIPEEILQEVFDNFKMFSRKPLVLFKAMRATHSYPKHAEYSEAIKDLLEANFLKMLIQ